MPQNKAAFIYWMNIAFELAAVDGWQDVMVQDAILKATTGVAIPA